MGMDNTVDVRAIAVDLEVHRQLGRSVAIAAHLVAVVINDHHHVGSHEPLRHAFRRRHQPLLVEAGADVPSFEATKPRSYMRRPASTISARICSSTRVLIEGESGSRSHGDTKA